MTAEKDSKVDIFVLAKDGRWCFASVSEVELKDAVSAGAGLPVEILVGGEKVVTDSIYLEEEDREIFCHRTYIGRVKSLRSLNPNN